MYSVHVGFSRLPHSFLARLRHSSGGSLPWVYCDRTQGVDRNHQSPRGYQGQYSLKKLDPILLKYVF